MNEEPLDSPPRASLRRKLLWASCVVVVLFVSLFFIPGEEVVADIDLRGAFSGYAIRDEDTEYDYGVVVKRGTLEDGSGESYDLSCVFLPSESIGRYILRRMAAESNLVLDDEGVEMTMPGFNAPTIRRRNIFASLPGFWETKEQAAARGGAKSAILRALDEAIVSRSPHVTYRRLSMGESVFLFLKFRALLLWEDAQRWNQLGWRLK